MTRRYSGLRTQPRIELNVSEEQAQFFFEMYCEALRLSASGDSLCREWEHVTEKVWLEASKPIKRRCALSTQRTQQAA